MTKDFRHGLHLLTRWTITAGFLVIMSATPAHSASQWNGQKVFAAKGCTECHSVFGEGGRGAPDLGKKQYHGTYLELSALMWNHLPKMARKMEKKGKSFPTLSTTEMADLVAYLASVRYKAEPATEYGGRKLLESKECTACHKFGGKGGDLGPNISETKEYMSPIRLAEAMWNHGPKMMELFEKEDIDRPDLDGKDMALLAAGIRSYTAPTSVAPGTFDLQDPVKGEAIAKAKGCMACHAYKDKGGTLAPDFEEIDFDYSVTEIAAMMWNHGPDMWELMKEENLSFPAFEKGEMAHVIAYLYELKLQDAPGDAKKGEKVVRKRDCLSCHDRTKPGNEKVPDLSTLTKFDSPMAMITAMWNHADAMQKKLAEKDLSWPKLSARDMANVFAYIRTSAPANDATK